MDNQTLWQFLIAAIVGFLVTKLILRQPPYSPQTGRKALVRTPRGTFRCMVLAVMEDAWTFSTPIARDKGCLPVVGDLVTVEITEPRGRTFFRSKVIGIDPEPYRILMAIPEKVYSKDRRSEPRSEGNGELVGIEGQMARLIDISSKGAKLESPLMLKRGLETAVALKDASRRAIVLSSDGQDDVYVSRLMFIQ